MYIIACLSHNLKARNWLAKNEINCRQILYCKYPFNKIMGRVFEIYPVVSSKIFVILKRKISTKFPKNYNFSSVLTKISLKIP